MVGVPFIARDFAARIRLFEGGQVGAGLIVFDPEYGQVLTRKCG